MKPNRRVSVSNTEYMPVGRHPVSYAFSSPHGGPDLPYGKILTLCSSPSGPKGNRRPVGSTGSLLVASFLTRSLSERDSSAFVSSCPLLSSWFERPARETDLLLLSASSFFVSEGIHNSIRILRVERFMIDTHSIRPRPSCSPHFFSPPLNELSVSMHRLSRRRNGHCSSPRCAHFSNWNLHPFSEWLLPGSRCLSYTKVSICSEKKPTH